METTQQVLRREAQRARYRHAWWIALVAGVSGNALLVLAMWAAAPRPAPAAVTVMPATAAAPVVVASPVTPPVIVVVPPAAPVHGAAAFGDLGPCPAPHTARTTGAVRQPSPDVEITHLAGAPSDSRWVVAWSDFDVFASKDGGASWDEVLEGPGRVVDATFDCHGRVLVLRERTGLGMRDGAREAWRAVPGVAIAPGDQEDEVRYRAEVVGGGRSIAVLGPRSGGAEYDGEAWAAITDDGGVTWRHADLGWYEGDAFAAWHGDTLRVVVPWTDCMSEGTRLVTITAGGQKADELGEWTQELGLDRGTPYMISEYCDGRVTGADPEAPPPHLCLWRDGRGWRALSPAPVEARGEDGVVFQLLDGPTDVLVRNGVAQTLTGGRLGRARTLPEGFQPMTTDLAGRIWGMDADGRLARR